MALQGRLDTVSLPTILQILCDEKKTGILRVKDGEQEFKIYYLDGSIIYGLGSHKRTRLGNLLRSDGVLTDEQVKNCLEVARAKKLTLGKVLVDRGFLSMKNLEKYIAIQVSEILYNILKMKHGEFWYEEAEFEIDTMYVFRLNTMGLIMDTVRRVDENPQDDG